MRPASLVSVLLWLKWSSALVNRNLPENFLVHYDSEKRNSCPPGQILKVDEVEAGGGQRALWLTAKCQAHSLCGERAACVPRPSASSDCAQRLAFVSSLRHPSHDAAVETQCCDFGPPPDSFKDLQCRSVLIDDRLNNSFSIGKLARDYERIGAVFAKLQDGRQDLDFWNPEISRLVQT